MTMLRAEVRPVDRARAIRAILGFRNSDLLAVEYVVREAAEDTYPEAAAKLILALTEAAARFIDPTPDADEKLRMLLLNEAQYQADQD
jgi:hypothetical protein